MSSIVLPSTLPLGMSSPYGVSGPPGSPLTSSLCDSSPSESRINVDLGIGKQQAFAPAPSCPAGWELGADVPLTTTEPGAGAAQGCEAKGAGSDGGDTLVSATAKLCELVQLTSPLWDHFPICKMGPKPEATAEAVRRLWGGLTEAGHMGRDAGSVR